MGKKKKVRQNRNDEMLVDIIRVGHMLNANAISYAQYKENGGKYEESDFYEYGSFNSALELCGFKVKI